MPDRIVQQIEQDLLGARGVYMGVGLLQSKISDDLDFVVLPCLRRDGFDAALHEHVHVGWLRPKFERTHFGASQGEQIVDQRLQAHRFALHHTEIVGQRRGRRAVPMLHRGV
jgi:hypothetical protein